MNPPGGKRQRLEGSSSPSNSTVQMAQISPRKETLTQTDEQESSAFPITGPIFSKKAQSFKEIVTFPGFVDRTLFVKELLESQGTDRATNVMIFAPTKFGKTLNLNMVHLFLGIECNEDGTANRDVTRDPTEQELSASDAMKVFRRDLEDSSKWCHILNETEFVKEHFGRHPVVLLDFKNSSCERKTEAIFKCAMLVRNAYDRHAYLARSKKLAQSHYPAVKRLKLTCEKWINYKKQDLKNLSTHHVFSGLEDLIKSLRKHWGREPVLLVDEIDKPIVYALKQKVDKDNLREIGAIIINVVFGILKTNDNDLKLAAALITGISKVVNAGLAPLDNTTSVYFLSDCRFSKYYGMTEREVTDLVKNLLKGEREDEITKIHQTYNGYYQHHYSDGKEKENSYARYCLFSVLSYIDQKLRDNRDTNIRFWKEGGLLEYIVDVMMKSEPIKNDIHCLMFDICASIPIQFSVEVDAVDLLGLYKEEEEPERDQIFNFFLQRGFLARDPNIEKEGNTIHVKIPNLEVRALYDDMFKSYFTEMLKGVKSSQSYCEQFLKNLPGELDNHLANRKAFQTNLNDFCSHLSRVFRSSNLTNETTINSVMWSLVNNAGYKYCQCNFEVKFFEDEKPDRVFIDLFTKHDEFVIIFEMKFNANANSEHHKPGDNVRTSLAAAEDIVKLLPNKPKPEYKGTSKAGSGDDLRVLSQLQIKNYLLVGLAVDGDGTAHMLVFPNSNEWGDVIQVCVEPYVKEVIDDYLKRTGQF